MDDFVEIPPPTPVAPGVLTLDLAQHGPYTAAATDHSLFAY